MFTIGMLLFIRESILQPSALKQKHLAALPKRTEALHGLLDVAVGLN